MLQNPISISSTGRNTRTSLGLNMTAMDFRQYDNALGRFHSVDALAELMPWITPYHFGFNNPVYWSDPTGLVPGDEGEPDDFAWEIWLNGVDVPNNGKKASYGRPAGLAMFDLPVLQARDLPELFGGGGDDIRFRDKNGDIVATYKTDKYDDDVYLPVNVPNANNINLNEKLSNVNLEDIDVIGVGVTGDFTFVMGGGTAVEAVYFLDGRNAGKSETFKTTRQNVGANVGYGGYGIVADFYDDKNLTFGDYTGRSFSVGGDWGVGSFNTFWAPKNQVNDRSGFKSMFNEKLRSWTGYNIGVGLGGVYQWSKQTTEVYNSKNK